MQLDLLLPPFFNCSTDYALRSLVVILLQLPILGFPLSNLWLLGDQRFANLCYLTSRFHIAAASQRRTAVSPNFISAQTWLILMP
jgi:hypothetical protein